MARRSAKGSAITPPPVFVAPYPPSWINRLADWVERLPGPAWFPFALFGVHRLLVQEKGRLMDEAAARLEAGVSELHRRMDRGELAGIDDLTKALASLEIERAALERVLTWPWEPGTLRGLVAALLVPLIIWLIQALLEKTLGG